MATLGGALLEAVGADSSAELLDVMAAFFPDYTEDDLAPLRVYWAGLLEAQRQRNVYWETHRPQPLLDGKPFEPLRRTPGPVPAEPPPYGPPSDWLHDQSAGYRCLVCRDSGFVRQECQVRESGFGQAVDCQCRTEHPQVRAALIATRLTRSGIAPALARCTLETFTRRTGTTHALNAVYALCAAHRTGADGPRWLVLYGEPGTGKTHLLTAALQQMLPLAEGFGAGLGMFLDACKANQFARYHELTQQAIDAPILLFDEVGAQGDGDWGREKVERILNARYERQAWTLLGITMASENVTQWSPRLASRFADRRLAVSATLTCSDYRRQGGAA
jgi:DNA replication protein DnaC